MPCASLPSFSDGFRQTPSLALSLATAALVIALASCNSASRSAGTGGVTATGGASTTGGYTRTGGTTSTGGTSNASGASSTGGTTSTIGSNVTGGSTSTGGTSPTGGVTSTGGTSNTGGVTSTGGTSNTGGVTSTGGTSSSGGTSSTGGTNATGGTTSTGGAGGSASAGACPADAFFCSEFEDSALPAKATYVSNLSTPVEVVVDTTVHNTGTRCLKVNPGTSYVYRMVSIPAAKAFWFRVYMMTDVPIDQKATVHESFMGANWGQDKGVDIVQEQCEVAVNINDNPVLGSNGQNPPITCPANGQKLAANTWYCFEGSFDGATGNLEVFVDGTSIIKGNAIAQAKQSFTNFRFGYVEYNGTNRTVWYDDVATAPSRIGCLK